MLIYLLKSFACLAVFLLFYKLFLERENMHVFKRFYLLVVILLAYCIPLITITYYIEPSVEFIPQEPNKNILGALTSQTQRSSVRWSTIIWTIYGIGVLILGIFFVKNIVQLLYKIRNNSKIKTGRYTTILLQEVVLPHTFFDYIFLNKNKFETQQIPKAVLLHEEIHAKQKHSVDVLLIELIQVVFWFNPLIYVIKQAIKLNHEFLADQAVINKGVRTSVYQNILLAFSSNAMQPQLANSINYSSIKKRFTIMKTQTSKKSVLLRSILVLPILTLLLYGFSNKNIVQKESPKTKSEYSKILQEKASRKMVAEYNALAKKYNTLKQDERKINYKDLKRIEYIYGLMTKSQKERAEPYPKYATPPAESNAAVMVEVEEIQEVSNPVLAPNVIEVEQVAETAMEVDVDEIIVAPSHLKSPSAPDDIEIEKVMEVPSPPSPKSPLEFVKEMVKKKAVFFYDGNKINSKKAIELVKNSNDIDIIANHSNDNQYEVNLSTVGNNQ